MAGASAGQVGHMAARAPDAPRPIQPFLTQHQGIYGAPGDLFISSSFLPGDGALDAYSADQEHARHASQLHGYNYQHQMRGPIPPQLTPLYPYALQHGASSPAISSGRSTLVAAGETMGSFAGPACSAPQAPSSITAPTAVSTHNAAQGQKKMISIEEYEKLVGQRPVTDAYDVDKHICAVCNAGVARGTLRRHLQTHVPKACWPREWVKTKTCHRCGRTLSRSDGLKRHLESNICSD